MRRVPHVAVLWVAFALGCGAEEARQGQACTSEGVDEGVCLPADEVDRSQLFIPNNCNDLEMLELTGEGELKMLPIYPGEEEMCCYPAEFLYTDDSCQI